MSIPLSLLLGIVFYFLFFTIVFRVVAADPTLLLIPTNNIDPLPSPHPSAGAILNYIRRVIIFLLFYARGQSAARPRKGVFPTEPPPLTLKLKKKNKCTPLCVSWNSRARLKLKKKISHFSSYSVRKCTPVGPKTRVRRLDR